MENEHLQAVGPFIRSHRKGLGWVQEDIGTIFGVSKTTVSNWEKGDGLTIEKIVELGRIFSNAYGRKINLLHEAGLDELASDDTIETFSNLRGSIVPRYNIAEIGRPPHLGAIVDSVKSHFPCSETAFAIVIADRDNATEFLPGDSVIIDPTIEPRPEDMVLARVREREKPVFRRLLIKSSNPLVYELKANNAGWGDFEICGDEISSIIGVMTEHAKPRR